MHLGSKRLKVAMSWSSRRIRLGVTHSGTPSGWVAPQKEAPAERKPQKGKRR